MLLSAPQNPPASSRPILGIVAPAKIHVPRVKSRGLSPGAAAPFVPAPVGEGEGCGAHGSPSFPSQDAFPGSEGAVAGSGLLAQRGRAKW